MSDERFGRYRLVRRIGVGGMAEVFLAELVGAEGVTRELVIKKILHTLSLDPEAVAMFVEEARIAARLHHPNVVQVYEFGRAGDGYFLAMERVDGCDLATLLRADALPPGAIAWVFAELLEGLAYVHTLSDASGRALGLVHRDISPHNVLLGTAGEVKLADFGIATATARVDASDGVKGKFAYMAPEQARGEPLDARADLFAVGAMLYEALSGRRMHPALAAGEAPVAVRAGRFDPISVAAPGLHPALAAVVARAVSVDVEGRFRDARAFRESLVGAFAEAAARPDRESLRALVRRQVERSQTEASRQIPERTLTAVDEGEAVDDTAQNDRKTYTQKGHRDTSGTRSFEPVSTSRRVLERIGIAFGIFTLAVLAERRTRPHPEGRALVRVALPDEPGMARWFERDAKPAAQRACRCRIEVRAWRSAGELGRWLGAGEVDLAAVTSTVLPALRRDGLVGAIDGPSSGNPVAPPRAEIARALAEADIADGRWMLPAALDLVVMGWRADALRELAPRAAATRGTLESALDERTGTGLPARYSFEADPAYWTWWDLLVAGWAWRSNTGGARVDVQGTLPVWIARAAVSGAAGSRTFRSWTNDPLALEDSAGWEAILASMEVSTVPEGMDTNHLRSAESANVRVAQARSLIGSAEEWELGPVPRGDSWLLDPGRDVLRRGATTRVGEVLGWVFGRRGGAAADRRRVFAVLGSPVWLGALAHAWRGLPVRVDASVTGDEALRRGLLREEVVLRGGAFSLASGGATLAEVTHAERAIEAIHLQAWSGRPSPFVGGGRWWVPTIREAVARALGLGGDGGS